MEWPPEKPFLKGKCFLLKVAKSKMPFITEGVKALDRF
jgi:hypothetical protein